MQVIVSGPVVAGVEPTKKHGALNSVTLHMAPDLSISLYLSEAGFRDRLSYLGTHL